MMIEDVIGVNGNRSFKNPARDSPKEYRNVRLHEISCKMFVERSAKLAEQVEA